MEDRVAVREVEPVFVEPPWNAPLDADAAVALVPEQATISGMFLMPLAAEAKRRGIVLPSARERYVAFHAYPLREHARLLVETCRLLHPEKPIRQVLRRLGRGAPEALVATTLGKVVLGSVEGVHDVVRATVKAYPLNVRPCRLAVLEAGPGRAIVRLEDIHFFLDSHHVGAFEGVLRYGGVSGGVRLARRGPAAADLLLEWTS